MGGAAPGRVREARFTSNKKRIEMKFNVCSHLHHSNKARSKPFLALFRKANLSALENPAGGY